MNINSIDEYEQAHSSGWHRGFAAGFACAAVVALATVFCLLAYGTFDKPIQATQINKLKDKNK